MGTIHSLFFKEMGEGRCSLLIIINNHENISENCLKPIKQSNSNISQNVKGREEEGEKKGPPIKLTCLPFPPIPQHREELINTEFKVTDLF